MVNRIQAVKVSDTTMLKNERMLITKNKNRNTIYGNE